jgi:hypothetical protein
MFSSWLCSLVLTRTLTHPELDESVFDRLKPNSVFNEFDFNEKATSPLRERNP